MSCSVGLADNWVETKVIVIAKNRRINKALTILLRAMSILASLSINFLALIGCLVCAYKMIVTWLGLKSIRAKERDVVANCIFGYILRVTLLLWML
jgi:hypothetical protein